MKHCVFECSPVHDSCKCPPHWSLSPYLPPLLCTHRWLWGIRNSTQDPLTPISSPGGSLPPSLGQSSPNCPAAVLSPGQVATRWDRPSLSILPPAWEIRGFFMGDYYHHLQSFHFYFHLSLWIILFSMVSVYAPLWQILTRVRKHDGGICVPVLSLVGEPFFDFFFLTCFFFVVMVTGGGLNAIFLAALCDVIVQHFSQHCLVNSDFDTALSAVLKRLRQK